jgi:AhpD family alkylhydroperoxidase
VARDAPLLLRAYTGGLSPSLRETVMLAVSKANGCDRCVRVHEQWAARTPNGATEPARVANEHDPDVVTAAVEFASHRTANVFESMPDDARHRLLQHFNPGQARQLDAIVRLVTLANLTMSSLALPWWRRLSWLYPQNRWPFRRDAARKPRHRRQHRGDAQRSVGSSS